MWIFLSSLNAVWAGDKQQICLVRPAFKSIKPPKGSFNDRQVVNRHLCVVNWCPHSSTIFKRANKLRRALNLRAIASPFGCCYGRRWKKSTKWSADSIGKHSKSSVLALWDPLASGGSGIIALNPWIARRKSLSNYFFVQTRVDTAKGQSNFCKSSFTLSSSIFVVERLSVENRMK